MVEFGSSFQSGPLTEAERFMGALVGIPGPIFLRTERTKDTGQAEGWIPKTDTEIEDFMADMGPGERPPEAEIDYTPPDLGPAIERLKAETGRLEGEEK